MATHAVYGVAFCAHRARTGRVQTRVVATARASVIVVVVTAIIFAAVVALPLAGAVTRADRHSALPVARRFMSRGPSLALAAAWSTAWPRARMLFGVWAMAVAVSCTLLDAPLLEILTGLIAYALSEWKVPATWRSLPERFRLPLACTLWAASAAWLMGARFCILRALTAAVAVGGCAAMVIAATTIGEFITAACAALVGVRLWDLGFTLPAITGMCMLVFAIVLLHDAPQRLRALAMICGAGVLLALHVPAYAITAPLTWRVPAAAAAALIITGLWQARRRS